MTRGEQVAGVMRWGTLLAVGALLLPGLAFGGAPLPQEVNRNALFYAVWSMDEDANGIDDRLDAQVAAGSAELVYLHIHYGRRPTQDDALLLQERHGVLQTYVFRNWDDIQAEVSVAQVPGIRDAPGVVAVEQFVPPQLELFISAKNIRARQSLGEPVVDGIDHSLAAHETLGFRGEGMVLAVLDTGVDNTHDSLDDLDDIASTNDPKLLHGTDLLGLPTVAAADSSSGFIVRDCIDPLDDNGHGTHVAGTAIGTGGAQGFYRGVAPKARLVDLDISTPNGIGIGMAVAFDWIIDFNAGFTCFGDPGANRIDVATMSFGSGGDNPQGTLNVKMTDVVRSGITFTSSAGNSGSNAGTLTKGAEGAIIVGASDDRDTVVRSDDTIASFSSRGPRASDNDADTLDELRPDVAAPGTAIAAPMFHTLNRYQTLSGTSMSAPHVGGIALLILQANPSLRPVDKGSNAAMGDAGAVPVRDILIQSAQYKTSASTPPQFSQIGRFGEPWNNAWGYGLVDAYGAIQLALAP